MLLADAELGSRAPYLSCIGKPGRSLTRIMIPILTHHAGLLLLQNLFGEALVAFWESMYVYMDMEETDTYM